jgi:hypothetical protein
VRLRYSGKVIDRASKRVRPGRKAKVALELPRSVQRRLARKGSLRMRAEIRGHRAGTEPEIRRIRVVAPR